LLNGLHRSEKKHSPYLEVGCLLLTSVLIVARQFTHPQFASCVIDDSILQMSWVKQFTQVLGEGVWSPRWLPESNGGYGSPVFVFYSPLVYYITAVFQWASGSIILSMKLVRGLGLFLSGVAMLAYASHFLERRAALAIAVVYIAIPFHVLDVSYWSLYAETWAWVWFPLILLFMNRIRSDQGATRSMLGLSLSYTALILTHLISAYMVGFVIGVFALTCWARKDPPVRIARILMGVLGGLALSAFYLFPAFYERRFVRLEYSTLLPEFDFRNTFLFFPNSDLICANPFQAKTIHMLQLICVVQGIWILSGVGLTMLRKPFLRLRQEVGFQAAIAALCLFLMTSLSSLVWEWVPGLPQIQFSTRWLSIYSLAGAILVGLGFQAYSACETRMTRFIAVGHVTATFAAALASLLIILGGCFLTEKHSQMAAASIYNAPEYNPKDMKLWKQRVIQPGDPPYSVLDGKASVSIDRWSAHDRDLNIRAEAPTRIKIRLLYYPGWTASCDGRPIPLLTDPDSGAIVLDIPTGFHRLRIRFEDTLWRKAALGWSILTAFGMFFWAFKESCWK
jgi:hypothetical protein